MFNHHLSISNMSYIYIYIYINNRSWPNVENNYEWRDEILPRKRKHGNLLIMDQKINNLNTDEFTK